MLRAVSVSESQLFFKVSPSFLLYILYYYIYYYISISYKTERRSFSIYKASFFLTETEILRLSANRQAEEQTKYALAQVGAD